MSSNTTLGALAVALIIVLGAAYWQNEVIKKRKKTAYFSTSTTFKGDGKGGISTETVNKSSGEFKITKAKMGRCKHVPKMIRKCSPFSCTYNTEIPLFKAKAIVTRSIKGMKDGKCKVEEILRNKDKKVMNRYLCNFPKNAISKASKRFKHDWAPREFVLFIDDYCKKSKS